MLAVLLFLFIFTASCSLVVGDDGTNGSAFLAIDWVEQPEYYTDTNPAIPTNLAKNNFYLTETGTFDFEYGYSDGFGWEGYYIIERGEPGIKGDFFRKNGSDGKDNYYTLLLTYNGSQYDNYYEKNTSQNEYYFEAESKGEVLKVYMKRFTWNPSELPINNKLEKED